MVPHATARLVALQEKEAARRLQEHPGWYGPEADERLAREGLQGVVYSNVEIGKYMYVADFLTEEYFKVPVNEWSGHHWHSRPDRNKYLCGHLDEAKRNMFWS
jgi:hypothetical protein